jgi:hypothetical protein
MWNEAARAGPVLDGGGKSRESAVRGSRKSRELGSRSADRRLLLLFVSRIDRDAKPGSFANRELANSRFFAPPRQRQTHAADGEGFEHAHPFGAADPENQWHMDQKNP